MGRPALYGTESSTAVARIRQEAHRALREEAEREGRPMGRLIADAVERELARRLEDWEPILRPDCPNDDQPGLELDEAAA